ncbi:MAG TPA: HXXEE domain-containing protein [Pyrinomonadaceae bacterium]|nr:HXXEE domain-containing protein [Pyrinomonadaceae bacterium]
MDLKNHHHPLGAVDFWSWLFPVTYLIHIAEEYWGGEGYPAYLLRVRGVHLTAGRFWLAQTIGTLMMALGIYLARRFNFAPMMAVIMAATVLGNALTHALTSISNGGYGPGLISALFIWMPLGIWCLILFRNDISKQRYWLSLAIGAGVNIAVYVIAMRGARL